MPYRPVRGGKHTKPIDNSKMTPITPVYNSSISGVIYIPSVLGCAFVR